MAAMSAAVSGSTCRSAPAAVSGRTSSSDASTATEPSLGSDSLVVGAGSLGPALASGLDTGGALGVVAPHAVASRPTTTIVATRRLTRTRAAGPGSARQRPRPRTRARSRSRASRRSSRPAGHRPPGTSRRRRSRGRRGRRRRPRRAGGEALVACACGRRDAGDDRRQRRVGQGRVQVARALRPRIGGQRPELAYAAGVVLDEEDLGVAPEDAQPAGEQPQLARRVVVDRGRGPARARTGCRRRRRRRPERVGRAAADAGRGERVGGPLLEVGEERVVDGRTRGRRRPRRRVPRARTAGRPSTRDRRPPSSRTSDGRSPGSAHGGTSPNVSSSVTSTMRMRGAAMARV